MSILKDIQEEITECIRRIEAVQLKAIQLLKEEVQLEEEKNKEWIVAISPGGSGRVILHLSALTPESQSALKIALNKNYPWISFNSRGGHGTTSTQQEDALGFYGDTKVVLPFRDTK